MGGGNNGVAGDIDKCGKRKGGKKARDTSVLGEDLSADERKEKIHIRIFDSRSVPWGGRTWMGSNPHNQ